MGTTPVFSEVIGVSFDTEQFENSVEQLQAMWKAAMEEMSGSTPVGGIETSGSSDALASLSKQLDTLGQSIKDTFKNISTETAKVIKQASQEVANEFDSTTEKGRKAFRDHLNEMAEASRDAGPGSEESANFAGAAKQYLDAAQNPKNLTDEAQRQMAGGIGSTEDGVEGKIAQYEDLTAAQKEWSQEMTRNAGVQMAAAEAMDAKQEKAAEKAKAADEEKAAREVQSMGKAQAAAQELNEQREQMMGKAHAAAIQEDEERTQSAGKQMASAQQIDEQRTQMLGKAHAAAIQEDEQRTRSAGVQMSMAEEMDQRRQAAIQREGQSLAAQRDAAYKENEARARAAAPPPTPQAPSKTGFGEAFMGNFTSEAMGNMAGMIVSATAIGVAIGAVYKAMELVVGEFKAGFDYLSDLEMKAALLQGVIASNTTLSKDFATNYKMAGEAASGIQQQIQDASIQYGITTAILDRSFKQLVDGGGVSLVRTLSEAVQVSNMFAVSLQAAGKDADTSRAIMSELPKMLEGTEKPTSFILETLGLTNVQWDAMVAHAKVHHDLLEQLTPLMQNYLEVAKDAANRQQSLTQAITLEMSRIMAAGEKDAFAGWKSALQGIKTFLEENKIRISSIVSGLVSAVETLGSFFASVVRIAAALLPLKLDWGVIGMAILSAVEALRLVADGITMVFNITAKWINLLTDPSKWANFKENLKDAVDYSKEQFDGMGKSINAAAKRLQEVDTGQDGKDPTATFMDWARRPENEIIHSKDTNNLAKPKTNNDPLHDLQKEMADQLEASKMVFDSDTEHVALLLAQRKISTREADEENAAAARREYLRQEQIVEKIKERLSLVKGAKPASVRQMAEGLQTKQEGFADTEQKRESGYQDKGISATLTEHDRADEEGIAAAKRESAEKIALAKYTQEYLHGSKLTELDDTVKAEAAAHSAVDAYYADLIKNAGKDAELVQKYTAAKKAEDDAYNAHVTENSEKRVALLQAEFDKVQQRKLKPLIEKRDQIATANQVNLHDDPGGSQASSRIAALAAANVAVAEQELKSAQSSLSFATATHASAGAMLDFSNQVDAATNKLNAATTAAANAQDALEHKSAIGGATVDVGSSISNLADNLKSGASGQEDASAMAGVISSFATAVNTFHDAANTIYEGFKKGGVIGGIGASASEAGGLATSLASHVGDALGPIFSAGGPILSAVGGLFSAISSIFQQEIEDEVNSIQRSVTAAMSAYQNQQATLQTTVAAIQEQETKAISELSGAKGGNAALATLLPQLNNQIAQLQLQIQQIFLTFNNSLQDLQLNNTALSSVFDKWQQINTAVQAYLGAGGSVAVANQTISDSLLAMKTAAGDAINQGYQTAISDALNLNNLIQQRMQMEQQEAQSQFGLVNGDALERQGTRAITVGTQIQQQQAQYQLQLQNLNSTIDLTQQKVNLEGQIFNIAMSTTQLQQTSNALQIQQLQEQLVILKGQQDIYNGISQGANGQYGMSNTLMNEIGVVNIIVTAGGTVGDTSAASPQNTADAVAGVLQQWSRAGMGMYINKS